MPRKVPWEVKERWYEAAERGTTVASLANDSKKDPRTVQRGVDEVRQHRLAAAARTELLKEGLRRHQEELLGLVRATAEALVPLPSHLELRFPGVPPPQVLELGPIRAFLSGEEYTEVRLVMEEEFLWGLLRAHLGKDSAYRRLAEWKAAALEELNARLALKNHVVEVILREAELELGDDPRREGNVTARGLDQVVRAVVSRSVGEVTPYAIEVDVSQDGGLVINHIEAGCLPTPEFDLRALVAGLPQAIATQDQGLRLQAGRAKAAEQARRAAHAFLEVRASHYLPGSCRSCKRYAP